MELSRMQRLLIVSEEWGRSRKLYVGALYISLSVMLKPTKSDWGK